MSENMQQLGVELVAEHAQQAINEVEQFDAAVRKASQGVRESSVATQGTIATTEEFRRTLRLSITDIGKYTQDLLLQGYTLDQVARSIGVTKTELAGLIAAEQQHRDSVAQTMAGLQGLTNATTNQGTQLAALGKKMLLWTVGAASMFRLIMKIRREFVETVKELYKNTEGYKELDSAIGDMKDTFVAAMVEMSGGEEGFATLGKWIRDATADMVPFLGTLNYAVSLYDQLVNKSYLLIADPGAMFEEATRSTEQFYKDIDAILAGRGDEEEEEIEKRKNLELDFMSDLLDAYRDHARDIRDLDQDLARERIDIARDFVRKLLDIQADLARDIEDINRKLSDTLADINIDLQRDIEEAEAEAREERERDAQKLANKLLDIEEKYQDRLWEIRAQYEMDSRAAIAARDALALVDARRRRDMETEKATRDRDRERNKAIRDWEASIQDQKDALEKQRQDAIKAAEERRQDAILAAERERRDAAIDAQRKRDDAKTWFDREKADAKLSYDQRLEDLNTHFGDVISDMQEHYIQEVLQVQAGGDMVEAAYRSHLNTMLAMYNAAWSQMIPRVTGGGTSYQVPSWAAGTQRYNVSGSVGVNAQISSNVAGMDGRIGAVVGQALEDAFRGHQVQ